jgi:Zn-finger nucleic acid-binding protein
MLICPVDRIEMQPVKADAHYGQTVFLDQCSTCGGIWFDSGELYMPKYGEAEKIERLNVQALQSSALIDYNDLHCPRDQTKLIRFQDPFFPKDLIIARCQICNGFWLGRGEFIKYQEFRQVRQHSNQPKELIIEDSKFEQDMRQILEASKNKDHIEMVGKLGKFLSMPVDQITGLPLEPDKLSDDEKTAYNLVMTALNLIFRFFIRI